MIQIIVIINVSSMANITSVQQQEYLSTCEDNHSSLFCVSSLSLRQKYYKAQWQRQKFHLK